VSWTLVVTSHGRWPYLHRALSSIDLDFFDRKIFAFDGRLPSRKPGVELQIIGTTGWDAYGTGSRQGLTANQAQALGALTSDDEWVFWLEEDFVVHDAPLEEMADTLDAYRQVANMVLVRQPWSAEELRYGSVLSRYDLTDRGGWMEHTAGFWLNPMVSHASLLRTLTPGVEQHLTNQCRARGLTFGWWGDRTDKPRVEHIGAEGGMGSPGWKP